MTQFLIINNAGAGRNQALRTALAIGAACGQPLKIYGIVGDDPRDGPGLGPGHFTAIAAAAKVCKGKFKGKIGFSEIEFLPGIPQPDNYTFDVASQQCKGPAPLSWILETILPALARAGGKSQVILRGGTHILGGVSSWIISQALVPFLKLIGASINYTEIVPGFYPQCKGEVEVTVRCLGELNMLQAEQAFKPIQIGVEAVTVGLPLHLAEQALESAISRLKLYGFSPIANLRQPKTAGRGLAITTWARDIKGLGVGFDRIGRRGGQPRVLGLEAAETLVSFLEGGASMPGDLATILTVPLACAWGISRLNLDNVTPSLRAALRVIEVILSGSTKLIEKSNRSLIELSLTGTRWGTYLTKKI